MITFQKWGVLADFSNMKNIGTADYFEMSARYISSVDGHLIPSFPPLNKTFELGISAASRLYMSTERFHKECFKLGFKTPGVVTKGNFGGVKFPCKTLRPGPTHTEPYLLSDTYLFTLSKMSTFREIYSILCSD